RSSQSVTGSGQLRSGWRSAPSPRTPASGGRSTETGRYAIPTEADRFRLLIDYYGQICAANLPDGVGKMKQFACWFTHSVGNGSELRRIVHAARTPGEILSRVESFFQGGAAAGVRVAGA